MQSLEQHLRNGLYLGLSGIIVTCILYFLDIKLMILMRPYAFLALYIYWMRKSVLETKCLSEDFQRSAFRNAWLTFILGISLALGFVHFFASIIDPSITETQIEISKNSLNGLGKVLGYDENTIEEMKSSQSANKPFSLRNLGLLLPAYFIIPGALLALILSRTVRQRLFINQ
jgi:hypothetical protein